MNGETLEIQVVTQLEAKLKTVGAGPDRMEPTFTVGVSRPTIVTLSAPAPGLLRRLWHYVATLRRKE